MRTFVSVAAAAAVCSSALTPINISLATLPVVYFGGNSAHRGEDNIAMLAKMRAVMIEKWEGPCWDACIQNNTIGVPCDPACGGEQYMLDTLKRVKTANPNVATAYYQNSLYDWKFQQLEASFAEEDLNQRASNGSVIGMENDNGMLGVPVFALSKPEAVKKWMDWHKTLIAAGIDGTFLDKPNVFAFVNKTGHWNLCEDSTGPGKHKWEQACGEITASDGRSYNEGKTQLLSEAMQLYQQQGGFIVATVNGTAKYWPRVNKDSAAALINQMQEMVADPVLKYLWVPAQDQHTDWDPSKTTGSCSEDLVAKFLVAVEEGGLLGCNGWQDEYGNPLGKPLGHATLSGQVYTRHFESGTVATYDEKSKSGSVTWAKGGA